MTTREHLIEELLHSFHSIRNITKARSLHLGHQNHITHSQWFVLTMIEHFKKTNIKEIAEALEMSSSAATQLVDVLVQVNLVIRKEDPEDRRSVQLELSPKGKQHIAATKKMRINEMGDMFDGLTDGELEEFVRLHKKITSKS
ncbi:MAG: MarR family transcriptional regulator [Candidatus Daviesbacteria bacterium]|nr:MAG: MarR family transcriptional regulator [Candidatus Daviesbacteria bacterium]